MSTTSKSKTMIEGPLAKQILLVSLPLALSNLLQILFNMSDVAVVGRFAGSTALGSVGSTATFVTLFTGFLIGLSNGVNVLVARFYGAGHPKDVSKTVHSALLVSLAAGVLLLFIGLVGSPALLRLLNTKEGRPVAASRVSPVRSRPNSATVSVWVPLMNCGRTSAASAPMQRAKTSSSLLRLSSQTP